MVSVIAFLTISNIALGYGLAVYVHRHYGTLMLSRNRSVQPPSPSFESNPEVGHIAAEVVEPAVELHKNIEPAPEVEPTAVQVEVAATAVAGEPVKAPAVDEENVLAGIEEFRSQLAKMSSPQAASAEEPESELVEAAN